MDAGRQEPARAERDGDSGAHAGGTGAQEAQEVLHVPPGGGRLLNVLGSFAAIKVTGRETGGAYAVWEDTVPPGGGPPPHVHGREAEDFYVIEGELEIVRARQPPLRAGAGSYVHTPAGVAHTFKNAGTRHARMLVVAVPGGMEEFFAEVGVPVDRISEQDAAAPVPAAPPPPEVLRRVLESASRHGITILSPPESH